MCLNTSETLCLPPKNRIQTSFYLYLYLYPSLYLYLSHFLSISLSLSISLLPSFASFDSCRINESGDEIVRERKRKTEREGVA